MDTVMIKIINADADECYKNGDILEAERGESTGWYIDEDRDGEFDWFVASSEAEETSQETSEVEFSESDQELIGIDATLAERGERYGPYVHTSRIAQNIKRAFKDTPNWAEMSDVQKESLDMCANKFARILNGDTSYIDSWHDLVGYITLVTDQLDTLEKSNMSTTHP